MQFVKGLLLILLSWACPQLWAQDCDSIHIQLNTGIWAEEISWSISDIEGNVIYSDADFEDETEYFTSLCIIPGCYNFNMYDTLGDGWQGAVYRLFDSNFEVIQMGQLNDGFEGSDSFSFNIVCGCTDSLASNYMPQAGADDGSCLYCEENQLSFQLQTGIWAEEISWNLSDSLGIILYEGSNYLDNTFYVEHFCLSDACYYINMFDSFGDGWQGGEFSLLNENDQIIASGFVGPLLFEDSVLFSINGNCDIPGCLEPTAVNYNPTANFNDGSCTFLSDNVSLLGHWSKDSLILNGLGGSYTEVYGAVISEREYGIIGSTAGTHIIDVTAPESSNEVVFIPGAFTGSAVIHRDYHTYNDYLYAVCDQGSSTLQIIDISNLPDSAMVVYDSDELFSRTHNIFIDTLHSKLYAVSASGDLLNSSLLVYDISDETNPILLHDLESDFSSSHDIYVENDTAFVNALGLGLLVYDFNGAEPQLIGTLDDYPFQGGNHSGWLDNARDVYVFADENHGYDLKVCNVSDLTDIIVESTFNSDVDPQSVPHNLILRDNYVFLSYYHDGLQIFDISDPSQPLKAGYYDTYLLDSHQGFAGAWGVYPHLPSGNILISDIHSGLYVLGFEPLQLSICEGDSVLVNGSFESEEGVYITTVSDSIVSEDILVTELDILSNSSSFEAITLTIGDSILIDNEYISENGVYSYIVENSLGCDSVITLELSFVVGITEHNKNQHLTIYPNPFSITTRIEFQNPENSIYQLKVYNAEGRCVYSQSEIVGEEILFSKGKLNAGAYYFHLYSGENQYRGAIFLED